MTPIEDWAAFREALRRQMGERSQTEFGAAVAAAEGREKPYAQQLVSQWLNGTTKPSPSQVFAIERCVGLRPGALSRLLGYLPLDSRPPKSLEDYLRSDSALSRGGRDAVRAVYEAMIGTRQPQRRGAQREHT